MQKIEQNDEINKECYHVQNEQAKLINVNLETETTQLPRTLKQGETTN